MPVGKDAQMTDETGVDVPATVESVMIAFFRCQGTTCIIMMFCRLTASLGGPILMKRCLGRCFTGQSNEECGQMRASFPDPPKGLFVVFLSALRRFYLSRSRVCR